MTGTILAGGKSSRFGTDKITGSCSCPASLARSWANWFQSSKLARWKRNSDSMPKPASVTGASIPADAQDASRPRRPRSSPPPERIPISPSALDTSPPSWTVREPVPSSPILAGPTTSRRPAVVSTVPLSPNASPRLMQMKQFNRCLV